jgi:hypothetical protein
MDDELVVLPWGIGDKVINVATWLKLTTSPT